MHQPIKKLCSLAFITTLSLACIVFPENVRSQGIDQNQEKITFSGYVKDLGTMLTDKHFDDPLYDQLLHNRLELGIYPIDKLSFTIEGRNRLQFGDRIKQFSDLGLGYGRFMDAQDGLVDLSKTWVEKEYWVLHSEIDRLYTTYESGDWKFRLGRQRINWGKNLVWNPNDLFNTYSYYDFDYAKRPGADALRIQYFRNYSSSFELAFNPDETLDQSIGALYYSFHEWEYDFQVFSGYFQEELVNGFGWSGYIGGASFRGEMSYYTPTFIDEEEDGYLLASVSGEYTFRNSLRVHLEGLYNGNNDNISILQLMNSSGLRANNLSLFEYGVFGQLNYPVHPLLNVSAGSIYYPEQSLALIMPSMSYSVADNWELYLLAQLFTGDIENLIPEERRALASRADQFNLLGLRLQWSF